MHLITEQNFMLDPIMNEVPFWIIFNRLPLEFHNWDTIRALAPMEGIVHKDIATKGKTRKVEGYNSRIIMNIKKPLPKEVVLENRGR